jgi:hypothetical protein
VSSLNVELDLPALIFDPCRRRAGGHPVDTPAQRASNAMRASGHLFR